MGLIDAIKLSAWFEAYGSVLTLYARQWLKTESAEDVVQEVFIRLILPREEPVNVKAWLFRSVRNAAINRLRSQRRRHRHERRRATQESGWFEIHQGDLIDANAAQSALLLLPDQQREVIVLRIWAEMTLKEVAEVTGESVSTLFSRYRAGLAALRRNMEKSCLTKAN